MKTGLGMPWEFTLLCESRGNYICVIPRRCLLTNSEKPPKIYATVLLVLSVFLVSNLNLPCHNLFPLLRVLSMRPKDNSLFLSSLYFDSRIPIISPFGFLFPDWTVLTLSISLLSTASKENKYEGFRRAQKVSSLCPVRAMIRHNFTLYISKSQGLLCLSTSSVTGSSGRQRSSSFPQEKLSS